MLNYVLVNAVLTDEDTKYDVVIYLQKVVFAGS